MQFFERRPYYPWFVVTTVCIGAFMGQVDASIVQLAMPWFEMRSARRCTRQAGSAKGMIDRCATTIDC